MPRLDTLPASLDEFLDLAYRFWLQRLGDRPLEITVRIPGETITHSLRGSALRAGHRLPADDDTGELMRPRKEDVEADRAEGRRQSQCVDDILAVLEAAGRRLTTMGILSGLNRADKEWSQSYVSKLLAKMVEDGVIDNDPDARPRGYART